MDSMPLSKRKLWLPHEYRERRNRRRERRQMLDVMQLMMKESGGWQEMMRQIQDTGDPVSALSAYLQLLTIQQQVLDNNAGSFYTINVAANAGAFGSTAFTTIKSSWSNAILLGGFVTTPTTPATWNWVFTGSNTFTINVANNGGFNTTYQFKFAVLGN